MASVGKENSLVFVAIIITTALVFLIIVCILTTVVVVLARSRLAIQMKLKRLQANANVLYEEIPSIIEAKTNVAYQSVEAKSCN